MAVSIGESIALGNIASVQQDRPFANAIIRKQNLDLQDKAQKAKQAAEDKKREEDIAAMIQVKGGFLPYYQEDAANLAKTAYSSMMGTKSPLQQNAIAQQLKFNSENLLAENTQLAQNLNTARGKGLVPDKVFEIFNMPKSQANKAYDEYVKTNPEIQEIVYKTPEGKLQFNPVEKVNLTGAYDAAVQKLKETAIPKKDDSGNWEKVKMLDNTYQFRSVADPAAVNQTAAELAHDANFGANVRISQPKEYKEAYDKIAADAARQSMQVTQEDLKLAATAQVIKKSIEAKAIYNDIRSEAADRPVNFGFNNGGYTTKSKWILTPDTVQAGQSDASLKSYVDNFNKKHRTKLTVEQFFGEKVGKGDYEQVIIENADTGENKSFVIGNEEIIPVSIRRLKGTNNWRLFGKVRNPDYNPKKEGKDQEYITTDIPYDTNVRNKIDAIIGDRSQNVLDKFFPTAAPASPTPSYKAKVTVKGR